MKKFLMIFLLSMLGLTSQSYAATFNLGLIPYSQDFGNTISGNTEDSDFTDTYKFSTGIDVKSVAVSITNVAINFGKLSVGVIDNFTAKLDGETLELQQVSAGYILAKVLSGAQAVDKTDHELEISGIIPGGNESGSYGGNITLTPVVLPSVPVPAAIWLFGSALMGLVGMKRRKAGLASA